MMFHVCSADQQPSVEEESQCLRQAAAESIEAGLSGEALQCCPTSGAIADIAHKPHIHSQPAQNILC